MREKTVLRETYYKGTQVNKDQLPTTRHTLVYQPREMHLLAAGVVKRGEELLEYHDVRLYFPYPGDPQSPTPGEEVR